MKGRAHIRKYHETQEGYVLDLVDSPVVVNGEVRSTLSPISGHELISDQ